MLGIAQAKTSARNLAYSDVTILNGLVDEQEIECATNPVWIHCAMKFVLLYLLYTAWGWL
jgi:hypothetical protein